MLYLNKFFEEKWKNKDPFCEIEKLSGEVFRQIKSRRTLRFELDGIGFFIKIHHGVGWKEIFKNLFQLKLPILGAKNEYQALNKLHRLKIDTMEVCAFGERNINPAKIDSFIVTSELRSMESLEDYALRHQNELLPLAIRKILTANLGDISGRMHRNGINHRDYYICHFLFEKDKPITENTKFFMIDLHRAQIRQKTPLRYAIKDVAGIWFSSMDVKLSRNDLFRFMKCYSHKNLHRIFAEEYDFWLAVDKTARKLYRKVHGINSDKKPF